MKVTILGAGAYGLALALTFYRNNNDVTVWTKIENERDNLIKTRQNNKALPNVIIPEEITITTDISCCNKSDIVIIAIPINYLRSTCIELKNYINNNTIICIATKGIENKTNALCHEILSDITKIENIVILSGPTFAIDLANDEFCGLTLATNNFNNYIAIKNLLDNNKIKLEYTNDIIGTELCGSLKNIMAIISGLINGMMLSETTKALFYTQATKELKKLLKELNGDINTTYLLCGIGDLLLTCTSSKSRNYTLGNMLATSNKNEIITYIENNTVEGYTTLISIYQIIKSKNITSPLIEALYEIIFENANIEKILTALIK